MLLYFYFSNEHAAVQSSLVSVMLPPNGSFLNHNVKFVLVSLKKPISVLNFLKDEWFMFQFIHVTLDLWLSCCVSGYIQLTALASRNISFIDRIKWK